MGVRGWVRLYLGAVAMNPRLYLSGDEANESAMDWAEERYAGRDSGVWWGIKGLDEGIGMGMFPGQIFGVVGAKANGKTPLLAWLAVVMTERFKHAEPRKRDGKRPVVVYFKTEETVNRARILMWQDERAPIKAIANGTADLAKVQAATLQHMGDPLFLVGRTANRTGVYQLHGREVDKFRGVSVQELESVVMDIERNPDSPYYVGLIIADYLQATALDQQYQGKSISDRDRIAILSDRYFALAQWVDCPVIVGAQANLHALRTQPAGKRLPQLGQVWMTERFDHDLDGCLSIYHPIKDGLIPWTQDETGDYYRWAGKRVKITRDLFIVGVPAWRESDAPGLVVPVSSGGYGTGRPFGRFESLEWEIDPQAQERRKRQLSTAREPYNDAPEADQVPMAW